MNTMGYCQVTEFECFPKTNGISKNIEEKTRMIKLSDFFSRLFYLLYEQWITAR